MDTRFVYTGGEAAAEGAPAAAEETAGDSGTAEDDVAAQGEGS